MALPNRPKKIHLLGQGRHDEGVAAATITPGMFIALDSDGKLVPHPDAGKAAERNFAVEDALQGRTIEDDYKTGELVGYVSAGPGDVVFAWLALGEDVENGALLKSNGDGTLAAGDAVAVAVALEALDASESDAESDAVGIRIRVRVL